MTTTQPKQRIAIVGTGYWGKNIARTLARLEVLAAVVDDNDELAQKIANENSSVAARLETVLDDPTIDAIAIATPAATHFDLAIRAMKAGKDVFVEKPMALDPSHGEELIAYAAKHDRVLMVGHLLRYHPVFEALTDLVDSGSLGRLRYAYSNRLNFGKIRREEDTLWSFAPHDISMLLRLAGEEPSQIESVGTFALHERIADITVTHMTFPSALKAHVFVSWLHPSKEQRLVVIGDRAMAVFDDRADWSQKLAIFEGSVSWEGGVPVANPAEPRYVPIDEAEPLLNEMAHFVDCVGTRATPRTDGNEGLRVLRTLDAATRQILNRTADPTQSPPEDPAASPIHPTAVIDSDVEIGGRTRVWHFSHILGGSRVGEDCSLGQNVVVGPNVTVGSRCKIQNNVSIYEGVTLEDDVFCGPSMVFTNVTTPRAFVDRRAEFAPTLVKRGASIGANATIVCGSTIGSYSLIGAGAVVTGNVPAHALMLGVPARQAGWVSHHGEILGDDLVCPATGDEYKESEGMLKRTRSNQS